MCLIYNKNELTLHYSIVYNHKALHLDHVGSPGSGRDGGHVLIYKMNQLTPLG